MQRKRKTHPNWPYRFAWAGIAVGVAIYLAIRTLITAAGFGRRTYGIDWGLAFVASCFDATIAIFFFIVGTCIGSFLNVVAYRLPLGRYIGGHSSCPYCRTPIDGLDNVPVLAWIKLRGRCRACRLPISAQYPLVEFLVGIVFFSVYASEFVTAGANLPGVGGGGIAGLLRVSITLELIARLFAYLFALSSLIAAALIAVRRRRVPLTLYAYAVLPLIAGAMIWPDILVVSWRSVAPAGGLEAQLNAIVTLVSGAVTATAIARLLAPLLYPRFDRSLMGADKQSVEARQFIGAMTVAGAIVGWQSCVVLSWTVLLCATFATVCIRFLPALFLSTDRTEQLQKTINLGDLTVWVWLGLLVFRAFWATLLDWQILPETLPEVLRQTAGALALAPLAILFHRLANSKSPSSSAALLDSNEPDSSEPEGDEGDEGDDRESGEISLSRDTLEATDDNLSHNQPAVSEASDRENGDQKSS